MRIQRLSLDGFGNLKGQFLFSADRVNLILEPNERGKSTLAAAILAALYGFPRQRTSRDLPVKMKDRYRPWQGGPFGVELELAIEDRRYTIRRDFEHGVVAVCDGTGKDVTNEFCVAKDQVPVGEHLTGLSRSDFTRCSFIGQNEMECVKHADGLTHLLQRIATSQEGEVATGEALDLLTRAVERDYEGLRLNRGMVETEIKRLDVEIQEVRGRLEEIKEKRRQAEGRIATLEEAGRREKQAEAELTRIEYLLLVVNRDEGAAALRECERERRELEGYREELRSLEPYSRFPAHRLGELRELKGKVETLRARREKAQGRLQTEIGPLLTSSKAALPRQAKFDALQPRDFTDFSDRQAVLDDLWRVRREKRRDLRREERRLLLSGVNPERARSLAGTFAALEEEDRLFLLSYRERVLELAAARGQAERHRDRLLRLEGGENPALVSMAAARRMESLILVTGGSAITLAILLFLSLDSKVPALIAAVVAALCFLSWMRLLEKRPTPGAEEFGTELQKAQTEVWSHEKEAASVQERLSRIASQARFQSTEQLVQEYRELENLQGKAAALSSLSASLAEVRGRYDSTAAELLDIMRRSGRTPRSRLVTPRVARRFREQMDRYQSVLGRIRQLHASQETARNDLQALDVEIEALTDRMGAILESGLGSAEVPADLGQAIEEFARAAEKRQRRDRLCLELIPAAEDRHAEPPSRKAARLRKQHESLSRQVDQTLARDPDLAAAAPSKPSAEYLEERSQLQKRLHDAQKTRRSLEEELGDLLKECRREFPRAEASLGMLETARRRAAGFSEAVNLAREVLTAISREAYSEWAQILNDKTSRILRRVCPGYEDVRFDTDLSFTLREAASGRRLDRAAVDFHFSAGARDQVYLAVRLAVSEYIATTGVHLPFIFDDPFAAFDDDRFEKAMEFLLAELGSRHQIIILSCHGSRHRRWAERSTVESTKQARVLDLRPLAGS